MQPVLAWSRIIADLEPFEACAFDASLVARMQQAAGHLPPRPLQVAAPSFQSYVTSEACGCTASAYPVFSVTGGACALNCEHCQARILEPMIPALTADSLETQVRALARERRLGGFLLSGGSNRRNEIDYRRFLPAVERLKRDFPDLRIGVHTGLMDPTSARQMADAGIELAMMDMIGDVASIREVYHLDRPVADFAATLAALCATSMQVVPHVVIGLHFGELRGERAAIDICAAHAIDGLVLVVVLPEFARPGRFVTPAAADIGELFLAARLAHPGLRINLGCARPFGLHRRMTDAYAVMAGLDTIAFPSEGALTLASRLGRPLARTSACCALKSAPATPILLEAP